MPDVATIPSRRRRAIGRPGSSVLWGLVFLILAHLALTSVISSASSSVRDPEHAFKLRNLNDCLSQSDSSRPLVLMMGSSRVAMGYRPELVEESGGSIHFNYGICSCGPLLNLITLHRLLDAGIRPHTILLEVWPVHLVQELADNREAAGIEAHRLSWRDLQVLAPFKSHPGQFRREWLLNLVESWSGYRFMLMRLFAPAWLDASPPITARWDGIRERGWLCQESYRLHPRDDIYAFHLKHTQFTLASIFTQPKMTPDSRRALHRFVDDCRREGILVRFIWLPESPAFRGFYRSNGLTEVGADLKNMAKEMGTPLLEARDWIGEDGFVDGFHMTHAGAEQFTRHLLSDVRISSIGTSGSNWNLQPGLLARQTQPAKHEVSQGNEPFSSASP